MNPTRQILSGPPRLATVELQKMVPAFIGEAVFMHAEKRSPSRGERLALRVHVSFVWQFVSLACVATEARCDNIVPCGAAALVAGHDVIEIELRFWQDLGAVLAGELVPEKYIPTGEFYLQPWQAVVNGQHNDFWDADGDGRSVDHFRIRAIE